MHPRVRGSFFRLFSCTAKKERKKSIPNSLPLRFPARIWDFALGRCPARCSVLPGGLIKASAAPGFRLGWDEGPERLRRAMPGAWWGCEDVAGLCMARARQPVAFYHPDPGPQPPPSQPPPSQPPSLEAAEFGAVTSHGEMLWRNLGCSCLVWRVLTLNTNLSHWKPIFPGRGDPWHFPKSPGA